MKHHTIWQSVIDGDSFRIQRTSEDKCVVQRYLRGEERTRIDEPGWINGNQSDSRKVFAAAFLQSHIMLTTISGLATNFINCVE